MIITTTSEVPDSNVTEIIGIVQGISVTPAKSGFKGISDPQLTVDELKQEALTNLANSAKKVLADAVVDADLTVNSDGNTLRCMIVGTAVKLAALPAWHLRRLSGVDADGEAPPAEVLIEALSPEKDRTVKEFMELFELDRGRAENIYNAGFTDLDKLREAEPEDIKAVKGINPTIARIIKTKLEN